MDADLKQYLEEMETRINAHTDGKIDASEQRLKAHTEGQIDASEQRLKAHTEGQIDAVEQRLKAYAHEECEKVETKLLTEFHKWGRMSEIRTRGAIQHAANLEERLLVVEDRVSAIERKSAA
jgi:hypothetical protein